MIFGLVFVSTIFAYFKINKVSKNKKIKKVGISIK